MVAFKAYLDNLPISKCLILSNLESLFFWPLYTCRFQELGHACILGAEASHAWWSAMVGSEIASVRWRSGKEAALGWRCEHRRWEGQAEEKHVLFPDMAEWSFSSSSFPFSSPLLPVCPFLALMHHSTPCSRPQNRSCCDTLMPHYELDQPEFTELWPSLLFAHTRVHTQQLCLTSV